MSHNFTYSYVSKMCHQKKQNVSIWTMKAKMHTGATPTCPKENSKRLPKKQIKSICGLSGAFNFLTELFSHFFLGSRKNMSIFLICAHNLHIKSSHVQYFQNIYGHYGRFGHQTRNMIKNNKYSKIRKNSKILKNLTSF